jgi:hypothetical protein
MNAPSHGDRASVTTQHRSTGVNTASGADGAHVPLRRTIQVGDGKVVVRRTRETDPFSRGKSTYRIAEPLIVFYEAIMRREWTRLERGNTEAAWRNSQATFRSQVVGPHFEGICREWAMSVGDEVFGDFPGHVAAATVNDPRDKKQIQVDVAVLAPEETGRPRRILSPGEVKWDRTMTLGHVDRLRRARELLSAKGYDTGRTVLAATAARDSTRTSGQPGVVRG